jgi:hypothetical protein
MVLHVIQGYIESYAVKCHVSQSLLQAELLFRPIPRCEFRSIWVVSPKDRMWRNFICVTEVNVGRANQTIPLSFRTMLGLHAWRQHSPSDMLGVPHMTVLSSQDNIDHLPIPASSVCKAI